MTVIRELDRARDRAAIEAIDTSFETASEFELVTSARAIELVERALPAPRTKRYSIGEVFAPWASWERGWVADDGGVRGFATVEHEPWHQRIVLWFLYIEPAWRRRGIGRALLERVETFGRERGAFTPEFKAEAVRIARTPGKTITEVARELDLTVTCLRAWVKQAEVDERPDPQGPLTTEEGRDLGRAPARGIWVWV